MHVTTLQDLSTQCVSADRDMLKVTQQEFESVPLIIKVEVLVAALTCMWGKFCLCTLDCLLL